MLIVRSQVPLRQPEDGQYRPKHVVVRYIVIKYTSCDTVVFHYIQFSKLIMLYIYGTTLICTNISQPALANLSSTLYTYLTQHLWLPDDGCDLQPKHAGASNPTV